MEAPTGSLIKRRSCLPNFYDKATADKAQEYLGFTGVTSYAAVTPSVGNVVALKLPIYKSKVKKPASKNPELLDAYGISISSMKN